LIEKAPEFVALEKPDAKKTAKTREDEIIGALAAMEPGIERARAQGGRGRTQG
jgi:hypothetical protein